MARKRRKRSGGCRVSFRTKGGRVVSFVRRHDARRRRNPLTRAEVRRARLIATAEARHGRGFPRGSAARSARLGRASGLLAAARIFSKSGRSAAEWRMLDRAVGRR